MVIAAQNIPSKPVNALEIEFSQMAAFVETQLGEAILAFERRDVAAAGRVIAADKKTDAAHRAIDDHVMEILKQGPLDEVALRQVMSVLKMAADLERVGDLAKNVAKRTIVISREMPIRSIPGVVRMGRASLRQLSDVLNAYNDASLNAATAVWGGDDVLDELYNSIFREIMMEMMTDSSKTSAYTHLVFIAKNFERIGDHATNLAEALHYQLTGAGLGDARPKGDETSERIIAARDD
ncbi:MAG: phosphate signaling complex protein PhoU [Parvularculaceae bacterium]